MNEQAFLYFLRLKDYIFLNCFRQSYNKKPDNNGHYWVGTYMPSFLKQSSKETLIIYLLSKNNKR
ncbi:hypothetical protein BKI52_40320 [marine bacterium AO1-C]|nr:hypothetical protein BKI52_40320 [marine bacterium AO1-C]